MKNQNVLIPGIICCMLVASLTLSAQLPKPSPINPDYLVYLDLREKGLWKTFTDEGFALGYMPSPMKIISYSKSPPESKQLPAAYDLRNVGGLGFLSPVYNQGNCGSCWTFATTGSVESMLLFKNFGSFNLSENNLKQTHGFVWGPCDIGGNPYMSTAYFSRGSGPVSESDDPYFPSDSSVYNGNPPVMYIPDAVYLPKDMNTIKQAILDHGALYTNFYWDNQYYNGTDFTYYYNGSSLQNHAVTLVGWDDNKTTAGGAGAWIIKNSWGTGWGQAGFFYIAYQDTRVNTEVAYWPGKIDYSATRAINCYDHLGAIGAVGYVNTTAYALVKFIPVKGQKILKLGTYIVEAGTTVGFQVYDDFINGSLTNQIESISGQTMPYAGYVTLDLPAPIVVQAGNDFYVKIYYNTPTHTGPVPVEQQSTGYANPSISSGVCWMSHDGNAWFQLGNNVTNFEWDVCLKTYGEYLYDFGDAPEGSLAYPASGATGQFPTCKTAGQAGSYISHSADQGLFFGSSIDYEQDGNAGACPVFNPNTYNNDECYQDGDAGLIIPASYSISGNPGSESVVPCSSSNPAALGNRCQMAVWGTSIDIYVNNTGSVDTAYVNLIIDHNQDGAWGGLTGCAIYSFMEAHEHVLRNFKVPNGFSGALSQLTPPNFRIGYTTGYVWVRFAISEIPVSQPWNGSGTFSHGETEDYLLMVLPETNVQLQNMTIQSGQSLCFDAAVTITTGGNGSCFIAQNNSSIYLAAGSNVILLPGTHFQSGSYVHAYIDQTGEFCSNPKTIVFPVFESTIPEVAPVEILKSQQMFFKVYPNPTTGQFTLILQDVSETANLTVEIFSMSGEKVMGIELPAMKQYLYDLSAKQRGVYLIRIIKGDDVGIKKLIKL